MKYRLYVNVKCKNSRSFQSDIGIGGVILDEKGKEISFSKNLGKGTCFEGHIYAIRLGVEEILENKNVTQISIYLSNLMLVNYFNGFNVDISSNTRNLASSLKKFLDNTNIQMNFNYFEANEYNYLLDLVEDAINIS